MPTDILISSDPWENRVAILEDGKLSEIYVEREERVIGSIFKGKVQNVLPGMGASFVDIGLGRNAFLYVDDINKTPLNIGDVEITSGRSGWTINEKVSRGDDVLVQIVKEPRGLKGARISTNISLPGRYLILMPTGKYSGVSRKIESADERNRLKGIMKAIRPEGMATVVRTAAGGVSNAELIADLGVLIRIWHGILESFKNAASPSLLHKDMNLVYKAARDFITPDVQNVWIDDAQEAESVRDVMRLLGPQYVERIKPYPQGKQLFADFKIDDEIGRLMKPTVKLPSGGSIVIETTEALTVIDVNSGKFTGGKNLDDTIVKTNIEAAAEIARQVRLRDIGGIIVCDFIDMSSEGDRNKVIKTLEDGLRRDRTRSTIQSFSPLGLLEFTRKRVGKDLAGQLRGTCPTCSGLGTVMSPETVTISTFRQIANHQNGHQHVHIAATPAVAAQAEFWYEEELLKLGEQIGQPIDVRIDAAVHPERPLVVWGDGLPELTPVRVGDEFDVELLPNRLPVPTSAAAVVNGRLIEVENAATAAGQLIKIRILDVDGNDIIAEPRTPLSEQAAEARKAAGTGKRRRRGGRGRKPLTAAEQEEELRELAEEAAKGLGSRPAPVIGISTTDEAVAEERAGKNEGVPTRVSAKVTANGNVTTPPARIQTPPAAARAASPPPVPAAAASAPASGAMFTLPGESLSGSLASRLPGETLSGDRVRNAPPPPPSNVLPFVAPPARPAEPLADEAEGEGEFEPAGDGESEIMHRRRRRRRRGRGGNGAGETAASAAAPAAPLPAPAAPTAANDDEEDDEETVAGAEPAANGLTVNADGEPRRRRRRRRRRGRGGAGAVGEGQTGDRESTAMPDRHIFRVDSDGGAHATGETSPPQPNRSIAPWNRPKKGEVAIEPPPPVLTAPAEPEIKRAAPSRRRRTAAADAPAPVREIAAPARVAALPAPVSEPAAPKTRRAKTTSAKAGAVKATVAAAAPKRATAAKKAPVTAAAKAPAKSTAAAKKSSTAPAKKAVAKKTATAKKSSTAKKSTAKASTAKKTAGRKKT